MVFGDAGLTRKGYEQDYLDAVRVAVAARHDAAHAERFVAYAEGLMRRRLPVLFSRHHLAFAAAVDADLLRSVLEQPGSQYKTFRIPKRRGGSRQIEASFGVLKVVQRWVDRKIARQLPVDTSAHGFVKGRSIATNAGEHSGSAILFRLDIRGFFDAIEAGTVRRLFTSVGYSADVADALAALTTYRGSLPQGAPSSPALANAVARDLDERLRAIAETCDVTYTRYADDLTFSGAALEDPALRSALARAVSDSGFDINGRKTRVLTRAQRQSVTGVVTNEGLNWPRERRRWLRQEIHYLERFGVEDHLANVRRGRTRYREFIYGQVFALNAVRREEAQPLLARLDALEWPY